MSRRRDRRMMGRALALARLNQGLTGKNPSVGCILLDTDGHIVGAGVTGAGGRPHAEEIALDEAAGRAKGGTAYVTLEPCRERSTGAASCSNRLVDAVGCGSSMATTTRAMPASASTSAPAGPARRVSMTGSLEQPWADQPSNGPAWARMRS